MLPLFFVVADDNCYCPSSFSLFYPLQKNRTLFYFCPIQTRSSSLSLVFFFFLPFVYLDLYPLSGCGCVRVCVGGACVRACLPACIHLSVCPSVEGERSCQCVSGFCVR